MDTRTKIVTLSDALARTAGQQVRWVRGGFDPLLAEHCRRLDALARPGHRLLVLIADPRAPLLPAAARAELVAALASVDYVVVPNGSEPSLTAAVVDLADEDITRDLVDLVRRRHSGVLSK